MCRLGRGQCLGLRKLLDSAWTGRLYPQRLLSQHQGDRVPNNTPRHPYACGHPRELPPRPGRQSIWPGRLPGGKYRLHYIRARGSKLLTHITIGIPIMRTSRALIVLALAALPAFGGGDAKPADRTAIAKAFVAAP